MLVLRSTRVVLPDGVRPASIQIDGGKIISVEPARLKGSRSSEDDDAGRRSASPSGLESSARRAGIERSASLSDVEKSASLAGIEGRASLSGVERSASLSGVEKSARPAGIEGSASLSGERIDVGDLVISPGLVDTHVHVNEPGRTEWEGFDTATRAAAAGGVTTLVDMPLNSVPATTTVEALEAKRSAARGRVHVDVAFWGGVIPGNAGELDALVEAGVRGFKCFLAPSGVAEFRHVAAHDLRLALPILARRDVPLLVHAEDPQLLGSPERLALGADDAARAFQPSGYATYLASRPPAAERAAVELMIRLARESGAHVHIVHVTCAEAVEAIARAKAEGVAITAETCPHYLTFTAGDIRDGATEFKCAPPIREAAHRDALWDALHSGALDLVATDHSPAPPSMKCGRDFITAWGGIGSLEVSLAAVFTALDVERRLQPGDGPVDPSTLRRVAQWMSAATADLAHLGVRKGRIAVGYDADLVIWDPDAEWIVEPARLQQRHKLTPYAGRTLRGMVRETYVRGRRVWNNGALEQPSAGTLL